VIHTLTIQGYRFRWYLRAARRGYSDAAFSLEWMYANGCGTGMNKEKAKFWGDRGNSLRDRRVAEPSRHKE
jgi:TPR repeat protein